MIQVKRDGFEIPPILALADQAGHRETTKAIAFYANVNNAKKTFKFSVYSEDEVKSALNTLFRHKCAYCETYYGASQPPDVEHFRPKGGVIINEQLSKPGYYWLAATWENLLPSCIDCNRARYHEVANQGRILVGKENQFPIADEANRATAQGMEDGEVCLLLNPCKDEPSKHLEFIEEGVVRAALLENGEESQMGRESIRVYALFRPELIDARNRSLILIRTHINYIKEDLLWLDDEPDSERASRILERDVKDLKMLLADDQPYLGMARQVVKRELDNLAIELGILPA